MSRDQHGPKSHPLERGVGRDLDRGSHGTQVGPRWDLGPRQQKGQVKAPKATPDNDGTSTPIADLSQLPRRVWVPRLFGTSSRTRGAPTTTLDALANLLDDVRALNATLAAWLADK